MTAAFNPYHKWLGIPPAEMPADYYRLLGVARFEDDPEVIQAAAEQRVAHLKKHESGPYGDKARTLRKQVSAAASRLLDPGKRAAYDARIRAATIDKQPPAAPPLDADGPVDLASLIGVEKKLGPLPLPKWKTTFPAWLPWAIAAAAGGMIAIAATVAFVMQSSRQVADDTERPRPSSVPPQASGQPTPSGAKIETVFPPSPDLAAKAPEDQRARPGGINRAKENTEEVADSANTIQGVARVAEHKDPAPKPSAAQPNVPPPPPPEASAMASTPAASSAVSPDAPPVSEIPSRTPGMTAEQYLKSCSLVKYGWTWVLPEDQDLTRDLPSLIKLSGEVSRKKEAAIKAAKRTAAVEDQARVEAESAMEKLRPKVDELRRRYEPAKQYYARLQLDAEVQEAIDELGEPAPGKKYALGPTGIFRDAERTFEKLAEAVALPEAWQWVTVDMRQQLGTSSVLVELVNGKKIRTLEMIVDSGATNLCMPWKVAEDLGLNPSAGTPGRIRDARGMVSEVRLVKIPIVSVAGHGGAAVARNVRCSVALPDVPDAPLLLGTSFLDQFKHERDKEHGKLVFYRRMSDTAELLHVQPAKPRQKSPPAPPSPSG